MLISVMAFIAWHYSQGISLYLSWYWGIIRWLFHYFSLPMLLKSLLAPYKRMTVESEGTFNLTRWFEQLTFNFISRWIGASVRIFFIIIGLIVLLVFSLIGALGYLAWVMVPFLGLPIYLKNSRSSENILSQLVAKIKTNSQVGWSQFLASREGKFILTHLGLTESDLPVGVFDFQSGETITSLESLIRLYIAGLPGLQELLRQKRLIPDDLINAARWWDQANRRSIKKKASYGRPGIGLELLFGFTPNLNQYTFDLGVASQSYSHHLIGRENVVTRIERVLAGGKNAIIIGQPGVGKMTVVSEFTRRARAGEMGPKMAYKRVLELDCNFILSGTLDINQKKTKLQSLLYEAGKAGNVILVVRDLHRMTNREVEGLDLADVWQKALDQGDLKIISIVSSVEHERFISTDHRITKYFETIEVIPPDKDQAMAILMQAADTWEKKRKMVLTLPVLRLILEGSDQYITETPFPEKALELLDQVISQADQNGRASPGLEDVNAVLSQKTGISFISLTQGEKSRLANLEDLIHQQLIGQDQAISLIAKSLRSRSMGTKKEDRPVGAFLFLGPTGVGKTQTAKVLAEVYYGSRENILRFDMAEFAGPEGLVRLIGSVSSSRYGVLTSAIKNRPASLLLLDEIEKAPPEVYNLFLSLLDEGSITDARGEKISCKHLFIIATSNAVAEDVRQLVDEGISGEKLQEKIIDQVQKKGVFSGEFLNRFDGVVVFSPLNHDQLVKVAKLLLQDLAKKLKNKNGITLTLTDHLAEKVAKDGYHPAFGARPMQRVIDLSIGDVISKAILGEEVNFGDTIEILPGAGKEEYSFKKL